MYYTNQSIKLHNRCIKYLELIQDANNRYEDKKTTIAMYDNKKQWFVSPKIYHWNLDYMERMEALSYWLVVRMQTVITEINEVNLRQCKKELTLSNNEVSTIEL